MDDVLDEWNTEMLIKSQIQGIQNAPSNAGKKKVQSFLCSLCSCFGEAGLRHDIGYRIKIIRERVDSIASEKDKYRLIETKSNDEGPERLKTSSFIDDSAVCGRAIEKDIIISRLLGESGSSSHQQDTGFSHPIIISIVGMGGLGKTTLAQLVFNDEQVQTKFEKTMWVCVSDPFDLAKLAQAIILEAGPAGHSVPYFPEWNNMLHKSLSEAVKEKRFLLVLDDVWNEDQAKWEPLQLAFRTGAQGSRILVTTRNNKVAKIMNSTYIYDLKILSDDDCWSLMRHIAFVGREKEEQETLTMIGIEIAKKCKGLPLAAKTLGSLSQFKSTDKDWQNVLESDIWELEEVEKSFLKPALLLSYYDLRSPLKSCFAYCSIFPKDSKMFKDNLIQLWMAQGFVTGRKEELEMIGEEYFNNLMMRSFFQDLSKDEHGNIISCKMHDLLHDLAEYLIKNECYTTKRNTLNYNNKIRHLICEDQMDPQSFLSTIFKAKNIRTFQLSTISSILRDALASDFFHNLKCLRVLSLNSVGLKNLSSYIGRLIHLRYLDLSHNMELKELPESITLLYNLQTLKLERCERLFRLPQEMRRMINLRHLNTKWTDSLRYLPQGFGKLTSLQILNSFPLSGASGSCKINELKDLNQLRGNLEITGLEGVKTKGEAAEAELKKKELHHLTLNFKLNDALRSENAVVEELESLMVDRMNGVLEGLQPHPKLEKLNILDYLGSKFPIWISSSSGLSNLRSLNLSCCINCIELPALGQLPSLASLYISGLNKLKHIGLEFYYNGGAYVNRTSFSKLKDLMIHDMQSLEVWDLGDGEEIGDVMPCLRHLKLYCRNLKTFPTLWKLPSLEILNIEIKGDVRHTYVGKCVDKIAFPKLKELHIYDYNLEVWDLSNGGVRDAMPCLQTIELNCPKMKALPVLGELPSLEILNVTAEAIKQIGVEFYRNGCDDKCVERLAFPSLKSLYLCYMSKLVVWDLVDGEVMPCLRQLTLHCPKLKALPGLGRLRSLETLCINGAGEVTNIGYEFYGICTGNERANRIAFPMLKSLNIDGMEKLEEWDLGLSEEEEEAIDEGKIIIMPCLHRVRIDCHTKLKTLGALAKLPSLEVLHLKGMDEVKHIGIEFYGLGTGTSGVSNGVKVFPNLKELHISCMYRLEEWEGNGVMEVGGGLEIMPCLVHLNISRCRTLKSLPDHHFFNLESLKLFDSSMPQLPSLPKLKRLTIDTTASSALPQGLAQLKELQILEISCCEYFICMAEELKDLTNLQQLEIHDCDVLVERCREDEGEDWSIISHIPNIMIDGKVVRESYLSSPTSSFDGERVR